MAPQTRKSRKPRSDGTCSSGYHPRKAYTVRRTGTRVPASCVRATTRAEPYMEFRKSVLRRMSRRLQGFRKSQRGPSQCPSGTIRRSPYVRIRSGKRIHVAASCIPDVGRPGKGLQAPSGGPGIGPLRKGDLTQFGYGRVTEMSDGLRHLALARAVSTFGALTVWRKLNAVYVYTRNTSPRSSAVFKADRDWIKSHYGITAF